MFGNALTGTQCTNRKEKEFVCLFVSLGAPGLIGCSLLFYIQITQSNATRFFSCQFDDQLRKIFHRCVTLCTKVSLVCYFMYLRTPSENKFVFEVSSAYKCSNVLSVQICTFGMLIDTYTQICDSFLCHERPCHFATGPRLCPCIQE